MATTEKANKNNFIRWNRITGDLTLAGLQALASTTIVKEFNFPDASDGLPIAAVEGSDNPSGASSDYNNDFNDDFS